MLHVCTSDSIKNKSSLKIILLSLLVLTGAFATAQHQSSQASQIITMRLQPVSFIDLTPVEKNKPSRHTDAKEAPASALHEIIVNKNTPQTAALPASSTKEEAHLATTANRYAFNESEPVYTFSSR
jgi:hypothetical protein